MNKSIANISYDAKLFLEAWEEVYKKGILTYWLLYYLSDKPHDAQSLYLSLKKLDNHVNQHSLHRTLRRLDQVGIINLHHTEGKNKYYFISPRGTEAFKAFKARNISKLTNKESL